MEDKDHLHQAMEPLGNGKLKSASKREQRKCIYSAEREQVQDDEVGLKRNRRSKREQKQNLF